MHAYVHVYIIMLIDDVQESVRTYVGIHSNTQETISMHGRTSLFLLLHGAELLFLSGLQAT